MGKTTVVDIHKVRGKRPAYDVYIGRAVRYTEFTQDSIWANLYRPYMFPHPSDCLYHYDQHIRKLILLNPRKYDLNELAGKKLGCWCLTTCKLEISFAEMRCHGQVLLKLLAEAGLN